MSGKPKITQPTQRAAPKPATRMQAPADDSNSENNSEDTPPTEDSKNEMEELRNMMRDTIREISNLTSMVQASNLNMDEKFKLFDSRVVELIDNKIETSSKEMNRKVEGRLEVDLKVIGESMHSVVKRLEILEDLKDGSVEKMLPQDVDIDSTGQFFSTSTS